MSRRSGLEYNPIWQKENPMAEMQSDVQFDMRSSRARYRSGSFVFLADRVIYLFPDTKRQKC